MTTAFTHKRSRRAMALKLGLGLSVIACIGATYAVRGFFARPGEAALRFVPAEAMFVAAIDLTPSPAQTIAFKHIDDALAKADLSEAATPGTLIDIVSGGSTPALERLKPLTLRNGAVAFLKTPENGHVVTLVYIALSDPDQARAILTKAGQPQYFRGTKFFAVGSHKSSMMVMDDLLVIGENPWTMHQAALVQSGDLKPVTSVAGFLSARGNVSDDANIKLFANPSFLNETHNKQLQNTHAGWMAMGLAIRDGGVGLSVSGTADPKTLPALDTYGQTPGVRKDLFQVLPGGAYGLMSVAQPSSIWDTFATAAEGQKDGQKSVLDMEKSLQDETGINLRQELIPGLKGDAVAALYPSGLGETRGANALVLFDDSNGATPAPVAAKLQAYAQKQTEKEGTGEALFTSSQRDGVTIYKLNDKAQSDIRKSLSDGIDPVVKKSDLVANQTVTWAAVGNAVILSSSSDLLDRAITAYKSHQGTLADDAGFNTVASQVLDGSQNVAAISLSRVAQGIRGSLDLGSMSAENRKTADSLLGAFESLKDPFTLQTHVTSEGRITGGTFIPLDYDKIVELIGQQAKK